MRPAAIRVNSPFQGESEMVLLAWLVPHLAPITAGTAVCEIESAKAVWPVEAGADGFLYHVAPPGSALEPGSAVGWILPEPDASLVPLAPMDAASPSAGVQRGAYTQEAGGREAGAPVTACAFEPGALLVYGTGSQATCVADVVGAMGGPGVAAFLDYAPRFDQFCGKPVVHARHLASLRARGFDRLHVCLPDQAREEAVVNEATALGFTLANVIHPSAVVSATASIGRNVYIGPVSVVGPEAVVADRCRLLNAASLAHHSRLGVGTHLTEGARIAGHVRIGARTLVGIGATVNFHLTIGNDVVIVSGAHVYNSVPDRHVVRSDGRPYPLPTAADEPGE